MKSPSERLSGTGAISVGALDLHEMPGHLIRRLQQIAVSIWLDETADCDVRPVQFAAMAAIRAFPGNDQMDLSRIIGFDRSTIQDVVIRLEKRGFIERRTDPSDKRRRILFITDAGNAMMDRMDVPNLAAQGRILEPLTDEEREVFMALLTRLVQVNNRFSRAPFQAQNEAAE